MRSPGMGWGGWLARGDVEIQACGNQGCETQGCETQGREIQGCTSKNRSSFCQGEFLLLGIPKRAELIQGKALGAESGMQIQSFFPPTSPTVTPVKPKPAFNLSFKRVHYRLSSKPGLHSPQLALLKFFPRCIYEEFINLISFNFFFPPAGSLCQALFYF